MPIHTSWKSMAEGMRKVKKYAKGKMNCRPFTDGSKVCMRAKAWQVFFATINKMGADETKPRPREQTQESKVVKWFESQYRVSNTPSWVSLAKSILNSPKFNSQVKAFWKKKLEDVGEKV